MDLYTEMKKHFIKDETTISADEFEKLATEAMHDMTDGDADSKAKEILQHNLMSYAAVIASKLFGR